MLNTRETLKLNLTLALPSHQVDLLQDKSPDMSRHRGREEQETTRGGGLGDEEEVASLCLIGLGMQLHSKSHGARFSFSMQDIDLEVPERGLLGITRCAVLHCSISQSLMPAMCIKRSREKKQNPSSLEILSLGLVS